MFSLDARVLFEQLPHQFIRTDPNSARYFGVLPPQTAGRIQFFVAAAAAILKLSQK